MEAQAASVVPAGLGERGASVELEAPAAWVVSVVLVGSGAIVPRSFHRAEREAVTVLHNYRPEDATPGSTTLHIAAALPTATARLPTGSVAQHAAIPLPTARPAPASSFPVREGRFQVGPG